MTTIVDGDAALIAGSRFYVGHSGHRRAHQQHTEDPALRDQLKQLEELQTHDAKIQELEQSLKAIPAKLAATEADLGARRDDARRRGQLAQGDGALLLRAEGARHRRRGERRGREAQAHAGQELEGVHGGAARDRAAPREPRLARGRDRQARRGRRGQEEAARRPRRRRPDAQESIAKDGEVARERMAEIEGEIASCASSATSSPRPSSRTCSSATPRSACAAASRSSASRTAPVRGAT